MVGPYDYSARVVAHRPLEEYSLWHCLGYVFYAPLYLAGPTLTFNAYMSQASTEFTVYSLDTGLVPIQISIKCIMLSP